MALRVSGGKPPVPPVEEAPVEEMAAPEEMMAEEMPVEEPMPEEAPEMASGGALDPFIAGYKGPEMGPFRCGNCHHYAVAGENTCEIVAGPIDSEGICNVFTPADMEEENMEAEEAPMEEVPMPEEAPIEEAPPEEPAY